MLLLGVVNCSKRKPPLDGPELGGIRAVYGPHPAQIAEWHESRPDRWG